jgi:uncharacterized membrane protein YbhN (UPF0104 family)
MKALFILVLLLIAIFVFKQLDPLSLTFLNVAIIGTNVVLLYSEKGRVSLETDLAEKKTVIAALKAGANYLKLDQYDKPLMSISNYKTEELQHIYSILFGDCPKLKKSEYYEKIVEKCAVHLLEKLI